MTEFEILELRQYYRNEGASAFRYWVSVTFAVLVAAYVAGDQLNLLTLLVMLTLYIMVTFTNFRVLRNISNDQVAIAQQIDAFVEEGVSENSHFQAIVAGNQGWQFFVVIAYAMRGILFAGTIVFLLSQAGYIGWPG